LSRERSRSSKAVRNLVRRALPISPPLAKGLIVSQAGRVAMVLPSSCCSDDPRRSSSASGGRCRRGTGASWGFLLILAESSFEVFQAHLGQVFQECALKRSSLAQPGGFG